MGTKAEELARFTKGDGCLAKSADDEPIFILCARDEQAPALIELWAIRLERTLGGDIAQKVRGARAIAEDMRAWQNLHGKRTPD